MGILGKTNSSDWWGVWWEEREAEPGGRQSLMGRSQMGGGARWEAEPDGSAEQFH